MKKMMKNLALVAVAAMGLTACQNDFEEQVQVKDSVVVNFVADSAESRTSVDTSGTTPVFSWNAEESFAVLEQTTSLAEATAVEYTKVDEKANIKATFDANPDKSEYKYVTIYPASGYESAESIESVTLNLPSVQTMAEGSYDPAADLMVSEVVTTSVQPTEADEAQMVRFTRLAAVVKMNVVGLEAGDKVESVTFEAEGQTLAGKIVADLNNPHEFAVEEGEGSSSVSVSTKYNGELYFTVLPATLEAGNAYTVTVITSKKIYIKKGVITEGKKLEFKAGMVTRFGVTLEGADVSDRWELVRDVKELKEGDVVIVAAKEYDMAMDYEVDEGNTKLYHFATEITKKGDFIWKPSDNVKQHTLFKHTDTANAFDFYSEGHGFLCISTDGRANLTTKPYYDNNTLFYISIDGETGVATVCANDSDYQERNYMKYSSFSDGYFACTEEDALKSICIYKRAGVESATKPVIAANVTVPQSAVVVGTSAQENDFEGVVFNYVDGWDIAASAIVKGGEESATWISLSYADKKLSYTVEENIEEARYATVSITATRNGNTETIGTFEVLQKGLKPTKISIAEFKNKTKDLDVTYEITGKITSLATTNTADSKIADADGNVANVRYIKKGEDWLIDSGTVKVGDIITVAAVVTATGRGGDGTYPATYIGHYGLTTTLDKEIVEYSGGTATIDVAIVQGGEITAPTNIVGNMPSCEGVEFSFADGKATVTFNENTTSDTRRVTPTFTVESLDATIPAVTSEVEIMQDINPAASDGKWALVANVADLEVGDKVIIAAQNYDVALSTKLYNNASETATNAKRAAAVIEKNGIYLAEPGEDVQQFVLMNGSVDGTFAFYDETRKAFLVSSTSSTSYYYLINQPYCNANASFAIAIADGATTIGNKEGDFADNKLNYYLSGTTTKYFYSGVTAKEPVCIYKLIGGKLEQLPVVSAHVTPGDIVIGKEAQTEPNAIEEVKFDYVGDWNISASGADWVTFVYNEESQQLNYTALANTNEGVRESTVTIKATLNGVTEEIGTFNVTQKGEPKRATIEEFANAGKNVNLEYIVTGKLTTKATSKSSNSILKDDAGNEAKFRYIIMESDGSSFYDQTNVIKAGDIVTFVASKQVATYGGYSDAIPTICKGYYNISAVAATTTPVSYEGGSVIINVETLGTLTPDEGTTISCNIEGDATVEYSGGATATVTFAANDGVPREAVVTFTYGIAEVSVPVSQENHPSVDWWLVTDASQLKEGDKVIIAALDRDIAISTASQTNNRKAAAITKGDGKLENVGDDVQQHLVEKGTKENTWAFKNILGVSSVAGKYLYASSSSYDRLNLTSTKNDNASWKVEIDATTGNANIVAQGTNSRNVMQYNNSSAITTDTGRGFTSAVADNANRGNVCLYRYGKKE